MATTPRSTLVTQAQALMKEQGLSYADAAKQARANITPTPPATPLAGTPPVTTPPVQNELTKQDVLQSTKGMTLDDRRNVMQNGSAANVIDQTPPATPNPTPTTLPPAPVTPTLVNPTPVTPTPTVKPNTVTPPPTEVKTPETPKIEPTKTPEVNFNTSVGRENEINTNLANITAGNQSLLTDRNAFNNSFGYATADAGKKALLDSFFQSKQAEITNPDNLYKTILSGATIPEALKNTPEYKTAQQRVNNYKKFTSYTPTQIETSLVNGDLLPGTQVYNDLYSDPNMKVKIDNAKRINEINGKTLNVEEVGTKKTNELMNGPLAEALSDNYLTQEEKDSLINTPDIKANMTKLQEEQLALNKMESEYKQIKTDVENEYKGTGATRSMINQIISNRQEDIYPTLELARENYNTNYGFYTELKTNSLNLFADNLGFYKEQKAHQETLASEKRQYENALSLEQAKFEQTLAQQAQLAKDPVTGVQQILKTYADMGILPTRSQQEIITDIENQVAQGIPVETALTNLNKAFQSKPAYQQYMAYQKAKMTPEVKTVTPEWKQDASGNWYNANVSTSPEEQIGKGVKPSGTISSATVNGKTIQLDSIASQSLNNVSSLLGSGVILGEGMRTRERQEQLYEAYKNGTGGLAASPGQSKHETGMAIDIYSGKDKNGKLLPLTPEQVKVMNDNGWVQNAGADDMGHFEYVGTKTSSPVGQYTDQNVNDLAYLVELQEKNPSQAAKEMKELGYTSRDLANYKGGNVPLTEKQKTSSVNLANSIKDLLENYDYTDATGFHFFDTAPKGSDWASAEEKIKTIVANMTLPQLGMLKGPMSDKDLAFIQAASSNLAISQNDEVFGKQLVEAYNIAARRVGLPEVKSLDDIKKGATQTQTGGGTVTGTNMSDEEILNYLKSK